MTGTPPPSPLLPQPPGLPAEVGQIDNQTTPTTIPANQTTTTLTPTQQCTPGITMPGPTGGCIPVPCPPGLVREPDGECVPAAGPSATTTPSPTAEENMTGTPPPSPLLPQPPGLPAEVGQIDNQTTPTTTIPSQVPSEDQLTQPTGVMWVNHLSLLPGDETVSTFYNAITSGIGDGLSGLVIGSTTPGETSPGGGNKVVETALQVHPETVIIGVRICYELSNSTSFISQIRLSQVQDPPRTALVILDDPTDLNNPGPTCVNSQETSVNATQGPILLSLRLNFGSTSDLIVIRGLGLLLGPIGALATVPATTTASTTQQNITGGITAEKPQQLLPPPDQSLLPPSPP
jgi:hypothetical protein